MAYISQIKLPNNAVYDVNDKRAHYYALCTTGASTAVKEITIDGFSLENGAEVTIFFVFGNTASQPSLKISNSSAVQFYCPNDNIFLWENGETVNCVYNGMQWGIVGDNKVEVVRL